MLDAILFDLDGTLTNTDPIHYSIWKNLLLEFGMTVDREFYDTHISGRLNADILRDILPHLSNEDGVALSDRKEALFREYARSQLKPLAGLSAFLEWVRTHQLKRAVVTNAPPKNAWFALDVLRLRDVFDVVVISEDLPHGKPHPMPYEVALQKLSVPASTAIAFEDSPSGIRSAVHAGIPTIGVTSTHKEKDLLAAGAAEIIADFNDPTLEAMCENSFRLMLNSHMHAD